MERWFQAAGDLGGWKGDDGLTSALLQTKEGMGPTGCAELPGIPARRFLPSLVSRVLSLLLFILGC